MRDINAQHIRTTNDENVKKLVIMEKISKLKEEKLSIETLGENFKADKAKIQGRISPH